MTRKTMFAVAVLALIALRPLIQAQGLPVVPGAFGFGMNTRAAYACGSPPTVYRVTTLADSGTGSIRAALEASGPRVVIFETSGTIVLGSDIMIRTPCVTIAGQTAPSPGITVKGFGIHAWSHDILMQHMRIRPGDGPPLLNSTADHDASEVYGGYATTPVYNVVFDHNSMSWAQGKLNTTGSMSLDAGVTHWRNIFSEALYRGANVTDNWVANGVPSSLGMLIKQTYVGLNANISVIQNLFAHNSDRNPEIQGPEHVNFLNNVVYDWGKDANPYQWASFLYEDGSSGSMAPTLVNIIGNKYIAGTTPIPFSPLIAIGTWNVRTSTQLYMSDNARDETRQSVTLFDAHNYDPSVGSPAVSLTGNTVMASSGIEAFVLANAGARPLDRDAVDNRIVSEVQARTGTMISSQNDVGGWPTLAVNTRALTLPANLHSTAPSGYTYLEEWLHGYASTVESGGAPIPPTPSAPKNLRITALGVNTETNALCVLLNGGFMDLYTGTQPADADTAISTQTRLASLGFSATACGAAVGGVASANAITSDPAGDASGTATWFRTWQSDHTTIVFDGSVGTTDADLVLNSTAIRLNKPVRVSSFTITSRSSN